MTINDSSHKLYLLPTPISKHKENLVLPDYVIQVIKNLDCFIVEKAQTAQSFLQWIEHPIPIHKITFRVLNKKTPQHEIVSFLKLFQNGSVGLMSEAGAPAVADPGSVLVKLAHQNGIEIVPLVGPSSIILALMSSGLNGQQFTFHGYLPLDESKRIQTIQELEKDSLRTGYTHIFMETPHRNNGLFKLLIETLRNSTKLCIAVNMTSTSESIKMHQVRKWKAMEKPDVEKKPALFLINAK